MSDPAAGFSELDLMVKAEAQERKEPQKSGSPKPPSQGAVSDSTGCGCRRRWRVMEGQLCRLSQSETGNLARKRELINFSFLITNCLISLLES